MSEQDPSQRLKGGEPSRAKGNLMRRIASLRRMALWRQLLRVDLIRFIVAAIRFVYFRRTRGIQTVTGSPDAVSDLTVFHNLKGLRDLAVVRSTMLIRPLASLEVLSSSSRILCVGPRTEGELLNVVAHGFSRRSVRGLDLISYSPWVDLGDMHAMPYPDDSWDVVMLAWVLAYSLDQPLAAMESIRVVRPGGIVAVGVEYNPLSDQEITAIEGYAPGNPSRLTTVAEILHLFYPHVETVHFQHDVHQSRRHLKGGIAAVFSINKEPL